MYGWEDMCSFSGGPEAKGGYIQLEEELRCWQHVMNSLLWISENCECASLLLEGFGYKKVLRHHLQQ